MVASEEVLNNDQVVQLTLSVEANAETWFTIQPEDAEDDFREQRIHLGALLGVHYDHADIEDTSKRLREGTDPLFARNTVRAILEQAADAYTLAVDGLTGLKTQLDYDRWLDSAFGRRTTKTRPYTCLKGDVNNFKRINDELGEDVGDEVMRAVGREVSNNLRVGDNIVAARPHSAGDEVIISAADLSEKEAKGLWARMYRSQLVKIDRQETIWTSIRQGFAERAKEEREVRVFTETFMVEGEDITVTRQLLEINGRKICDVKDLAIIDLGYSHGAVQSVEEAMVINAHAHREKDRIRAATRTKIEAYR